ncbi:MAG: GNAT family N-acetyltransferase, partial [Pseudomonadota bacterium]
MDLARTPAIGGYAETTSTPARLRGVLHLVDTQTVDSKAFLEDWKALARRAAEPNPFFEAWFTLPSFEQFADSDAYKIAAYWVGGRLAGVMPLKQSSDYYGHGLPHMSTWLHDHSFCGAPLVAKGNENGFWTALLTCLDQTPGQALFLHLPALPEGGALDRALDAVLGEMGRASAIVQRTSRALLASNLSTEDYVANAMSAKKRKELRRQRKRLAELGELTIERIDGTRCLEPWIEQYLTLEAAGWKGDAGSALKGSEGSHAFFSDTLWGCAKAGKLERLALRLDGR